MKKKFPGLRRSVKFDEEGLDLFVDIQTSNEADWKRIDAAQAIKVASKRAGRRNSTRATLMAEDIEEMLGEDGGEDE